MSTSGRVEIPDFRVMSHFKALNISFFSVFPGKLHFPFRSDAPEVTLSGFAGALREDKGTRNKDKGNPIKRGLGASAFSLYPLAYVFCPTSPTSRSWKTEFTRKFGDSP
jgi:hypothetical protein